MGQTEGVHDVAGRFEAFIARPSVRRAWFVLNLAALPVLFLFWWHVYHHPIHSDAYSTWSAWQDGKLYPPQWEPVTAYPYAPPLAQVLTPLTHISFRHFNGIWAGLQLAALVWMLRPAGAVIALVWPIPNLAGYGHLPYGGPVFGSLYNGNFEILVAAAIAFALVRWPGTFAFMLLTKVTAGVGVAWFIVRQEWKAVTIVVVTLLAIAIPSALINPDQWAAWFQLLAGAAGHSSAAEVVNKEPWIKVALAIRAPVGLAIVAVAAWRGWIWVVPIGCCLALPDIHLGGFSVLAAAPAVWWRTRLHPPGPVSLRPRLRWARPSAEGPTGGAASGPSAAPV
jgi:Glycosyltransferase family 87